MPTLVLDLVKGAELTATREQVSYLRMGFVDSIDLADTPDPDALVKVLDVLVSNGHPMGSALGPNSQNMKLSRVRIRSSDAKLRRVNLELVYETTLFNAQPTISMLRDRTFSIQKTSCFIPGSRIPILVGFSPTAGNNKGSNIAPEPVFSNHSYSARAIQVTVLMYGRPRFGTADYVNHVNNAPWPNNNISVFNGQVLPSATSKPRGYWKLNSYSTEYNVNAGMTLVQSEAITQVIEDWSDVAMMRNEKSGKYPFTSLDTATRISIYNQMILPSYSYGIIYPVPTPPPAGSSFTWPIEHGIIRWGDFQTVDFLSLMGF